MKHPIQHLSGRILLLACLLPPAAWVATSAVSLATARASSQDPKPPPPQPEPGTKGEPSQEPRRGRGERGPGGGLHQAMERMKGELKKVSNGVADPAKNEETLKAISSLQALVIEGKSGSPENLDQQPAADQPAFKIAFRKDMLKTLRDLIELEVLVLDGKNAEAAAFVKSRIIPDRDEGHDKYRKEE